MRIGVAILIPFLSFAPFASEAFVSADNLQVGQTVIGSVPPQPPPTGGGGDPRVLYIENVHIVSSTYGAVVSWTTTLPSNDVVYWGTSERYEIGQAAEIGYTQTHNVSIEHLEPGTQYVLSITSHAEGGRIATESGKLFRTERLPDKTPPANVSDFTATYDASGEVHLSWKNPTDTDFERVRIVRSDIFFPKDPYDGLVVYEGSRESSRDAWITPGTTYYYTAFAEDVSDNYSSGAIARVRIPLLPGQGQGQGDTPVIEPFVPTPEEDVFGGITILPGDSEEITEEIKQLSFGDFRFIQFGKEINRQGNLIRVNGSGNLEIAIGYDVVPEVLKTIGVTLSDPEDPDKKFPFLLRVNNDKSDYTATIAPLARPGVYRIQATVLDYKHQVLRKFEGKIIVPGEISPDAITVFGMCEYCTADLNGFRFLFCYGWIALLIILFILMHRRRRKKQQEK